jgi:hypothetical protein
MKVKFFKEQRSRPSLLFKLKGTLLLRMYGVRQLYSYGRMPLARRLQAQGPSTDDWLSSCLVTCHQHTVPAGVADLSTDGL